MRLAGTEVEDPALGVGGGTGGLVVGGGVGVVPTAWRAGLAMWECKMFAVARSKAEVVGERVRGEEPEESLERLDMLLVVTDLQW